MTLGCLGTGEEGINEVWNGGKVHRINDSVLHLMRGQIFQLGAYKVFTFGGARSTDVDYRKEHISWWKEEMPGKEEYDEGMENLAKCGWEVDYVITHTCSVGTLNLLRTLADYRDEINEINEFFSCLEEKLQFKHWYFGHFHWDFKVLDKQTLLYNRVLEI